MNVPLIIIVLAVVFIIVNLVLWIIALLGSRGTPVESEGKDKAGSLLESSVTEMLNIFKDVEDMINEIKKDNKQMVEGRDELPLGKDELFEKYGKDVKELSGAIDGLKSNIDKLKSNIDVNSSRMENLKNIMEELDGYLVKLSGSAEEAKED